MQRGAGVLPGAVGWDRSQPGTLLLEPPRTVMLAMSPQGRATASSTNTHTSEATMGETFQLRNKFAQPEESVP